MIRLAIILVMSLLSACGGDQQPTQEQYYGFFESSKGSSYKLFRHNIFGFEIHIPADWQFGVTGTGPEAVILIFDPEVDTSKFSPGYHTLSIGVMPVRGASLNTAYEATIRGLSELRADNKVTAGPTDTTVNGATALSFSYEWPSKTGATVKEKIRLISAGDKIYSVNIRTIDPVAGNVISEYDDAISTFAIL